MLQLIINKQSCLLIHSEMQRYCPKKTKCATIACVIERSMAWYMHVLVYHRSVNNKVIAHVCIYIYIYIYTYVKQKKYSKLSNISTATTQGLIRKAGEWKATHLSSYHKIPSPSYCYCKTVWKARRAEWAVIVVTRHWKSERTWSPDPSLFCVSVWSCFWMLL